MKMPREVPQSLPHLANKLIALLQVGKAPLAGPHILFPLSLLS